MNYSQMKSLVKLFGAFLFLTMAFSGMAQELAYLDGSLNETKKRQATYVRELTPLGENTYAARVTSLAGQVKFEGVFIRVENEFVEHGAFVFYHLNGKVESKGEYQFGVKVGTWERYLASGQRKADRYYNPESAELIRSVMTE